MDRNRCFECKMRVPVLSAAVVGTSVVLTIADRTLYNRETYCLDMGDIVLPTPSSPLQVVLKTSTGTSNFNILVKNGSYLYSDQLRSCQMLRVKAASDTSSFMVENCCIPCTTYTFAPQLTNTVAAAKEAMSYV